MSQVQDPAGKALLDAGVITGEQAEEITAYADDKGLGFGAAAVELGLVDQATLKHARAAHTILPAGGADASRSLVVFSDPHSPAAEDYRSLRNALALRWFRHPQGGRTLSVISAQRGDGRSLVAANIAACCAEIGMRTLLIDGDMRHPSLHDVFELDSRYGLSGYLAERQQEAAFHEIGGISNLSVMPSGILPSNPQELLLRSTLGNLTAVAENAFDVVIFDTPAAETGSDYQLIAAATEGALLVTRQDRTRTRAARQLVARCNDFGIRIVGSTMTSGD